MQSFRSREVRPGSFILYPQRYQLVLNANRRLIKCFCQFYLVQKISCAFLNQIQVSFPKQLKNSR